MDHNIIGEEVKHKAFGIGKVAECDGKHIKVSFESGEKTFPYPDVFKKFMIFTREELANEMLVEILLAKKEEKKAVTPIIAAVQEKSQEKAKSPKSAGKKVSHPFGKRPEIAEDKAQGLQAVDRFGYEDWTNGKLHLTVDDWKALVSDLRIFGGEDFLFFGRLYGCEEHACTAELFAAKEGKTQTAYNKQLFRLSSRILEKLRQPLMSEKTSWALMLLAKPYKNTMIWKIRPELVQAFEEVYPDYFK